MKEKGNRGGKRKGAGAKPKPPQEKGELIKTWPPKWLADKVRAEAQATGKSLSEIVAKALTQYFERTEQ